MTEVPDLGWTLEQVLAAQERANRAGMKGPETPLFQWDALQKLKRCEQQFADGDGMALFEGYFLCSMHGLPIPKWASTPFIKRYYEIIHFKKKTLDDAFGPAHKKGIDLHAARQRRIKQFPIYDRIRELREAGQSINEGLFESVGREFGVSRTVCKQLYGRAKAQLAAMFPT